MPSGDGDQSSPPKEEGEQAARTGEEGGPCFSDESCADGLICMIVAGLPICMSPEDSGSDGQGDGDGDGSGDGSGDGDDPGGDFEEFSSVDEFCSYVTSF